MIISTRVLLMCIMAAISLGVSPQIQGQDKRPVPKVMAPPTYPFEMARAGIGGAVLVEFTIDTKGGVIDARVAQSSNQQFETPALQAVAKWQFAPGEKNGRKVNTRAGQILEFNLNALPVFPFEQLLGGIKGAATVEFSVNANGQATNITVIDATHPEFGRAVVAQVEDSTYAPTLTGRTTSEQRRRLTQKFELGKEGSIRVTESARKMLQVLTKKGSATGVEELDHPLVSKLQRKPKFPPDIGLDNKTGSATIEFFIDETGHAMLPRIVSSTREEFGFAAAQAVSDWIYETPQKNKQPTIVRIQEVVNFERSPGDDR